MRPWHDRLWRRTRGYWLFGAVVAFALPIFIIGLIGGPLDPQSARYLLSADVQVTAAVMALGLVGLSIATTAFARNSRESAYIPYMLDWVGITYIVASLVAIVAGLCILGLIPSGEALFVATGLAVRLQVGWASATLVWFGFFFNHTLQIFTQLRMLRTDPMRPRSATDVPMLLRWARRARQAHDPDRWSRAVSCFCRYDAHVKEYMERMGWEEGAIKEELDAIYMEEIIPGLRHLAAATGSDFQGRSEQSARMRFRELANRMMAHFAEPKAQKILLEAFADTARRSVTLKAVLGPMDE